MFKALFALPFISLALIAAKPAEVPAAPKVSIVAPAEIAADPANRLNFELSNGGTIVVLLRPDIAPNHVRRIQTLASTGFYNGLTFHRVMPGFMAQGGDPKGDGSGGSPLPDLAAEFNDLPHLRGVISMARGGDNVNSGNSQFFIMLAPNFSLDHEYSAFGRVISGMNFVDAIAPGEPPAEPTRIVRAWLDGAAPAAEMPAQAAAPAPQPVATPVPADTLLAVEPATAPVPALEAPAAESAPAPVPTPEAPAAEPAPASAPTPETPPSGG